MVLLKNSYKHLDVLVSPLMLGGMVISGNGAGKGGISFKSFGSRQQPCRLKKYGKLLARLLALC